MEQLMDDEDDDAPEEEAEGDGEDFLLKDDGKDVDLR
jgi:hypothetical protein